MDFDFSDEQEQLRDAVRKWVDKAYSFDERRSVVAAGGFSASAYQAMAELAEPAATFPEVAIFRDSILASSRGITR